MATYVSPEYYALQESICTLQRTWKEEIAHIAPLAPQEASVHHLEVPLVMQLTVTLPIEQYLTWMQQLADLLSQYDAALTADINKMKQLLHHEQAKQMLAESLAINHYYFRQWATQYSITSWLPHFVAEHAVRPYLQRMAENYTPLLNFSHSSCTCPVCGEPVRLSILQGNGKKILCCPRCEARWPVKRLSCPHCGNEDHHNLFYLYVIGERQAQVQVCQSCQGYLKVLDRRQAINRQGLKGRPLALADLDTFHLDLVAQQHLSRQRSEA